jgi:hypothetical protein
VECLIHDAELIDVLIKESVAEKGDAESIKQEQQDN